MALNGWVLVAFSINTLIESGYRAGSRFTLLDVNENTIGVQVMLTLVGVLWVTTQLSKRNQGIKKTLAFVYLVMAIFIIFASGSRGSAISFAIISFSFLLWRTTRPWSATIMLLLILAIIFSPTIFTTTVQRFLLETSDSLSVFGGRERLWSANWEIIGDHPLFGVGIGNGGITLLSYLGASGSDRLFASSHGPVFVIWGETGLIGILLYLGILISAVIAFVRQYLRYQNISESHPFLPYFAIVSSVFLGYMFSWVKGGAMERAHSYFFMLALLLIPSGLEFGSSLRKEPMIQRKVQ
jgi:O-antigen ligase